eukprot:1187631-Prorocentrum_minimum.AAC.2
MHAASLVFESSLSVTASLPLQLEAMRPFWNWEIKGSVGRSVVRSVTIPFGPWGLWAPSSGVARVLKVSITVSQRRSPSLRVDRQP